MLRKFIVVCSLLTALAVFHAWAYISDWRTAPRQFTKTNCGKISVSPDGKYLLALDSHQGMNAYVWELASGKLLRTLTCPDGYAAAAISNRYAAVSTEKRKIVIYALPALEKIRTLNASALEHGMIAFSPSGTQLAVAIPDGEVMLMRVPGFEPEWTIHSAGAWPHIAYSRDGSLIAVAGSISSGGKSNDNPESRIEIWQASNRRKAASFNAPIRTLVSPAFSPDKTVIALAGYLGGSIFVFSVADGRAVRQVTFPERMSIWDMSFSPDGSLLALTDYHTPYLLRFSDGKLIYRFHGLHWYRPNSILFTPDGSRILCASNFGIAEWETQRLFNRLGIPANKQ